MPRKSKNSTKRNSNQFELLDDEDDVQTRIHWHESELSCNASRSGPEGRRNASSLWKSSFETNSSHASLALWSPPLQVHLISNSNSTCHLRHHPLRSQGHCQALGWT
ncbi:hypothetical protein HRG_012594 [Hirsutella rhossiliensis]